MAKRKHKKITRELVRAYFGEDAKISWFYPWRVKTLTGGEVVISQRNIKTITGTEDTHRAVMLLARECWGNATSRGSAEFVLAQVMHGEAAGVPVKPDYRNESAGPVAAFLLILFICVVMGAANNAGALLFAVIAAFVVAAAMADSEKRKARKKHEQMSFPYPRIYGSAGAARHDDVKRRGWL